MNKSHVDVAEFQALPSDEVMSTDDMISVEEMARLDAAYEAIAGFEDYAWDTTSDDDERSARSRAFFEKACGIDFTDIDDDRDFTK